MTITTINNTENKIVIIDSYLMAGASLAILAKTFKLDVDKMKFPYNFVQPDTLNYNDVLPELNPYDSIDIYNQYKEFRETYGTTAKFNMKDYTLKYLRRDLDLNLVPPPPPNGGGSKL